MGRPQTEATKRKLRDVAHARARAGGKFKIAAPELAFVRFVNGGPVLRQVQIGSDLVPYWPPGVAKSVPPDGVADADAHEQLQRAD
jgi:hypothetical protein|tara:strand:- start:129 stop:386 length:258 start_codon:yes stop_codon:yes gene_type:complete